MTAIQKVKNKLWMCGYKVVDMTEHKFVQRYDLVVEGIYRVAVRTLKTKCEAIDSTIDVIAYVDTKVTFYKDPYLQAKKLKGVVVDTAPSIIFIKNERTKSTRSARAKVPIKRRIRK